MFSLRGISFATSAFHKTLNKTPHYDCLIENEPVLERAWSHQSALALPCFTYRVSFPNFELSAKSH